MSTSTTRDPLAPLEVVIRVLFALVVGGFALAAVGAVVDRDASAFGLGDDVCATSSSGFSSVSGNDEPSALERQDDGLKGRVYLQPRSVDVCTTEASTSTKILKVVRAAPPYLVFGGFVLLARTTIRHARKHGLFSASLADRVEALGWLLLIGVVISSVVSWAADVLVLKSMTSQASWTSGFPHFSVPALIGAYGLVSIGRVMARAAELQADVDGTV